VSLRRPKLGVRARLLLAVVAAVAVALAAVIGGFNVLLAQRLSANATALARERAAARLSTLRVVDGHVATGEGPDSGAGDTQIWIYDGTRAIEQTAAREDVASAARALGVSGHGTKDVAGAETRLVAVPVVKNGRRLGSVVAGVSLGPYEETRNAALLGSTALGVGLLLAVALAARWMLAAALRPVARMTADADAWSEHGVNRRFAVGEPYDELTKLAATLDALLDRVAASLRHEQRLTAELSHELRTPVAKISAEAELALRRARTAGEYVAALEVVQRNAEQMTRTVDTLVAAAREEAGLARSTADARDAAAATIANCAPLAEERGVAIELDAPRAPLRVGVEADLVERILQPLLENACNYGRRRVRVSVERNGSGVLLTLEDDGPGVATEERERIFEPGARGSAASADADVSGAGLGLALSRRLARAAGGDVSLGNPESGARFLVQLPAA
jgi:signal transduction histidine kinase